MLHLINAIKICSVCVEFCTKRNVKTQNRIALTAVVTAQNKQATVKIIMIKNFYNKITRLDSPCWSKSKLKHQNDFTAKTFKIENLVSKSER
jgi:hypothetical protein